MLTSSLVLQVSLGSNTLIRISSVVQWLVVGFSKTQFIATYYEQHKNTCGPSTTLLCDQDVK